MGLNIDVCILFFKLFLIYFMYNNYNYSKRTKNKAHGWDGKKYLPT